MLVAYVSGHGFGHATRTAEVLRELRRLEPGLPIVVTTSAPSALFEGVVEPPLRVRTLECDVGLAQHDALTIDEAATAERWRAFSRGAAERAAGEAEFLRSARARVVLGDVPPLAFAAAAEAGVPSVALANFSWDWIYRHYAARHPVLGEAADACAAAYARCSLLLRLPFAGAMAAFPTIEDIPLVARAPRLSRADARRRLGLPSSRLALLTFGGIGVPGFRYQALAGVPAFEFVVVAEREGAAPASDGLPANVRALESEALSAAGVGYADLVGAVDVVVTKPGYGIVSDAIGAGTPIVYTERGDFPEYEILVEGLRRALPSAHVGNEALREGRIAGALEEALAAPRGPGMDVGGAEVAALRLLGFIAPATPGRSSRTS